LTRARELHTRLADLHAELAEVHRKLAAEETADAYFDQHTSPLGSRLHRRLVLSGAIVGYQQGRRFLVEASEMRRYLETHRVKPTEPAIGTQDEDDALLERLGPSRGRAA
jgi:hypothetical protein